MKCIKNFSSSMAQTIAFALGQFYLTKTFSRVSMYWCRVRLTSPQLWTAERERKCRKAALILVQIHSTHQTHFASTLILKEAISMQQYASLKANTIYIYAQILIHRGTKTGLISRCVILARASVSSL